MTTQARPQRAGQPARGAALTYARVGAHPRVLDRYARRLLQQGALAPAQLETWRAGVRAELEREYAAAEAGSYAESVEAWLATSWQGDALHVRCPPPPTPDRFEGFKVMYMGVCPALQGWLCSAPAPHLALR